MIDLSPDALQQAVETAGWGALSLSFLAGLAFSVGPVAIAAVPMTLAYVTHARERRAAIRLGGLFVLGMLATHVLFGMAAGLGGLWVERLLGRQWGVFLGPILIALGLIWAGWLRIPLPALAFRGKRVETGVGAFALGIPFSIAVCPVCTPALLALLGVVAATGSPILGGALLLAFALGRAVPLFLGAWLWGSVETLHQLQRFRKAFDIGAGLVLILTGLYLLNAYYFVVPSLAG